MKRSILRLETSGTGVEEWFTPGRFAVFLGVVLAVMFHEVLLGAGTLFYRDFGIYGYPLAQHTRESFWRGEVPLWNPLNNCGLPFLAQWNTMTLYPPSLFYLLLPLSWALGVFCVMHLFLAGMGMYWLAHRWTGNRLAASVAGVVFAVNGFSWHCLTWPNNVAAFGWMPWVVWVVERAWVEGGARRVIAAGAVGAMQMLAGAPEVVLLTWVFLAVLWVVDAARGGADGWWRSGRRYVLVVAVVAGLAAAQLVPFLDLLIHSQRDTVYGGLEWSMPGLGWANFLVPAFQTYASYHGVYVQYGQYWTTSYYVGVAVVTMALWAAWRVRDHRVWVLGGTAALALVLALGEHGYLLKWLHALVPQLGFMRFPVKFVVLVVFAAPLLAAFAISRYLRFEGAVGERRTIVGVTAAIGLLMGLIIWCAHRYPLEMDDWGVTWRNATGRGVVLLVMMGALVMLPRLASNGRRWACCWVLLLVPWLDVWTHSADLNPPVPRWVYEPGLVRAENQFAPDPRHGGSRAKVTLRSFLGMNHANVENPAEDYLGRRLSLSANCNLLDGIPKLSGFYALYVKESSEVLEPLRFARQGEGEALMEFLGVSHTTAPGALMDWVPRGEWMPFIAGGQRAVFGDERTTEAAVWEAGFAPRDEVWLPLEASTRIVATNRTEVTVGETSVSAHRISFAVEAGEPSMVTVAQAHYHPWKAYLDGQPLRIWRANHGFQGMEVPAGRHRVELIYRDYGFWAGVGLSLVTLFLCGALWRRARRARELGSGANDEAPEVSRLESETVQKRAVA